MKYVIGFVLIVMLVRIDVVLRLLDNARSYLAKEGPQTVSTSEVSPRADLISVTEDRAITPIPRNRFINMLETFASSPDETIRLKAMEEFKSNPTMFHPKLKDDRLEGAISSWRDLIVQNSVQLPLFLQDLLNVLQGENREIIVRFYSLMMDSNLNLFLSSYVKTKDVNCSIATVVGDPLADEEKLNELYDRERLLNAFVAQEKSDPAQKKLAENCLLVLRLHLAKITPPEALPGEASESTEVQPSETQP